MARFEDCPIILREFLSYHETIKGQSKLTIQEYYLDLRMFLRFMKLVKNEMPYDTDLETISIKDVDIHFIETITTPDIYDFLSYLSNDRVKNPDSYSEEIGIAAAARARKLSSLKSFYKYLTVRTKLLTENPVARLRNIIAGCNEGRSKNTEISSKVSYTGRIAHPFEIDFRGE